LDRRQFLTTGALVAGAYALAACTKAPTGGAGGSGGGGGACPPPPATELPYGPLLAPDANGIRLPAGFTSRVIARSDEQVDGTGYAWHLAPDGGACFRTRDKTGDYVYVSNSETIGLLGGGASAIRFAPDGRIRAAYRILADTQINCAGGPTPWGTWLSGEEFDSGQVWECDPFRASQGIVRPALGFYAHEAAAVDPQHGHVYLTEDRADGRLYRFVPRVYPDLSVGRLEVASVDGVAVTWVPVSDGPVGAIRPRPSGSTAFNGGEGIFYRGGFVWFTTKGDARVWRLDTVTQTLCIVYDDDSVAGAPLHGVDNVLVSDAGEVFVAEDGDNLEINVLVDGDRVGPLLEVVDQSGSELAGPAFSPDGARLYFSSQRGLGGESIQGRGITYEVSGPFRRGAPKAKV
jgi:hypothetical protein